MIGFMRLPSQAAPAAITPAILPATETPVSVIVPAYREAANMPELIERLEALRNTRGLNLELIIVNDESGDDTAQVVAGLAKPWVRVITRTTERGLSSAVLRGMEAAVNPILVVMDADLSHPPEAIPRLIERLSEGADMTVGSRYVPGGSTDDQWTFFRMLNSRVATAMSRPLTALKDPMSGFFALKRETFAAADRLNPVGYKIGLELLVKCKCKSVAEVPIHFASRKRGESKLTLAEQIKFLRHLGRLMAYRLRS